jgi:hypothetical protein
MTANSIDEPSSGSLGSGPRDRIRIYAPIPVSPSDPSLRILAGRGDGLGRTIAKRRADPRSMRGADKAKGMTRPRRATPRHPSYSPQPLSDSRACEPRTLTVGQLLNRAAKLLLSSLSSAPDLRDALFNTMFRCRCSMSSKSCHSPTSWSPTGSRHLPLPSPRSTILPMKTDPR